MKLSEILPGTVVALRAGRFEVIRHGPMGTQVRKLVQTKSGWGKRNTTTLSSECEAEIVTEGN